LRSLLAVNDLEFNLVAFLQTLVSLDVDRAVVALLNHFTVPFNLTFFLPPGKAHQHPHP
jgi:hypothetical protein